ncbi:MAG: hypothetical protein AB8B96_02735 [Lysobacterales bacterium]
MNEKTPAEMSNIEDIDLLMLYYGEHDDPELAAKVAASEALSLRMEAMSQDLAHIENAPLPEPDSAYAQKVWQQLVPELDNPQPSLPWYQKLLTPRFSLAGAGAVVAAVLFAFVMGQNMGQRPTESLSMDSQALLVQALTGHLQQAELLLTEVANANPEAQSRGASNVLAVSTAAQPLLRANRLYRVTSGSDVSPQLNQLLLDMETLLLQIANASSNEELGPVADYVDRDLLFRVRTLRNTLSEAQSPRI